MDATDLFKSLSEPVRLRILHLLSNTQPELCVCDLVSVLDLPQGTISRHLTHLRMMGLVSDRREGVWIYYRLAPPTSKVHGAMLQCLKSCFTEDPLLTGDLKQFSSLMNKKSLVCCMPQNPQGRPVGPSAPSQQKAKAKAKS